MTTPDLHSLKLADPSVTEYSPLDVGGHRPYQAPAPQLTVLSMVNIALRARYVILAFSVVALAVVGILGIRRPRTFSAGASFITQASKGPANLAGLAAQLGVTVAATDPGTSPAFYLDLLKSRGILGPVAESTFQFTGDSGRVTAPLDRILGVAGANVAQRRENAIIQLRNMLTTSLNQRTGVVAFSVRTRYPDLSFALAGRLIAELNRFNLERRQSQAAMERRFAQDRLAEVAAQLRTAEDRFQSFLQNNRGDYRGSPTLVFEAERLQRTINFDQQVYSALAQSVEQAKMDEVRDTPVITVVESPELPASPDARGLIRRGLVAFVVGGLLGLMLAVMREWLGRAQMDARDDATEFQRLRHEALVDIQHPVRAVRRLM